MKAFNHILFAAVTVTLLPSSQVFADPPSSCEFRVYNCIPDSDYLYLSVNLFLGSDSSHTFVYGSKGKKAIYYNQWRRFECGESDCDIDSTFFLNVRGGSSGPSKGDFCGNVSYLATDTSSYEKIVETAYVVDGVSCPNATKGGG